jgi:DNA modification methylase
MGVSIIIGDCRKSLLTLPEKSVNCCVTSPPYFGLRDYGHGGQIGQEKTPSEFIAAIVSVFREVHRVLRDDGTLWLNLGDCFAGSGKGGNPGHSPHIKQKTNAGSLSVRGRVQETGLAQKQLMGIPWRVAFALQDAGWYLRQDIVWHKPNPMPESVKDRCTRAHEYIFMLTKSEKYYYDANAIAEPAIYSGLTGQDASGFKDATKFNGKHSDKQRGHSRRHAGFNARWDSMTKTEQCQGTRNKRSVWTVATKPFRGAHFATFPPELIIPCILAGCPKDGTVLDPFGGAGTTGLVASQLKRNAILCELNPAYAEMARERITSEAPMFSEVA